MCIELFRLYRGQHTFDRILTPQSIFQWLAHNFFNVYRLVFKFFDQRLQAAICKSISTPITPELTQLPPKPRKLSATNNQSRKIRRALLIINLRVKPEKEQIAIGPLSNNLSTRPPKIRLKVGLSEISYTLKHHGKVAYIVADRSRGTLRGEGLPLLRNLHVTCRWSIAVTSGFSRGGDLSMTLDPRRHRRRRASGSPTPFPARVWYSAPSYHTRATRPAADTRTHWRRRGTGSNLGINAAAILPPETSGIDGRPERPLSARRGFASRGYFSRPDAFPFFCLSLQPSRLVKIKDPETKP